MDEPTKKPNAETIAAMKESREGLVTRFVDIESLMADLNDDTVEDEDGN